MCVCLNLTQSQTHANTRTDEKILPDTRRQLKQAFGWRAGTLYKATVGDTRSTSELISEQSGTEGLTEAESLPTYAPYR